MAGKSESERRLSSILRGAFGGPPTPLKEIPKRDGEPRSQDKHAAPPCKLESSANKPDNKRQAD